MAARFTVAPELKGETEHQQKAALKTQLSFAMWHLL